MKGISGLAEAHDLWVIEDCAQAHGARIGARPVGSFGTFGSFSFCQDKIMTTGGEGGMLVMRAPALWEQVWSYKDHGKDYRSVFPKEPPAPGFRWLHSGAPGTNLRMSGMAAAIGLVQLQKLSGWLDARRRNAAVLAEALRGSVGLHLPQPASDLTHAYYRYYAYVDLKRLADGWSRDRIVAALSSAGFPAFSGSCGEIYREKTFLREGVGPSTEGLPVARSLAQSSLAFLVDPTITAEQLQAQADCLCEIMKQAMR